MKGLIPLLLLFSTLPLENCSSRGPVGDAEYRLASGWPQLPDHFILGNPSGLDIDSSGHLIVFCRRERTWPLLLPMLTSRIIGNTVLVLDAGTGMLTSSWGAHQFVMPHGLTVDAGDNIWVTDVGLHQVFKFTHEGKLLLTLGVAGKPGNDSLHFNRPTDVAIAPDGCFYVSDGYRNSRIVKFSAAGKYLFEWGKKGSREGEFDIPHGLCLDDRGNVYVADRENCRIQVFDPMGRFLRQLKNPDFGNLCAIAFDKMSRRLIAVDDKSYLSIKHRGSDILILDGKGNLLSRFGRSGEYNGPTCWYHDLAIGKDGAIYVGDILGDRLQKFTPHHGPTSDQDPAGGRYSK